MARILKRLSNKTMLQEHRYSCSSHIKG